MNRASDRSYQQNLTYAKRIADDHLGNVRGVAVQGDELGLLILDEVLSYVPDGASLRRMLPDALLERIRLGRETRGPGAWAESVHGRVLSWAIRTTTARGGAVYHHRGDDAVLVASLGMTTWERTGRARLPWSGSEVLRQALQEGRPGRDVLPVPTAATRASDTPDLVLAPCIALPFPSADPGHPAAGAMLLVWGPDEDPGLHAVIARAAPLIAEAEHLSQLSGGG